MKKLDNLAKRKEAVGKSNNAIDRLNDRRKTNLKLLKLFKKWQLEDRKQ